jgi:hypothetical protein
MTGQDGLSEVSFLEGGGASTRSGDGGDPEAGPSSARGHYRFEEPVITGELRPLRLEEIA